MKQIYDVMVSDRNREGFPWMVRKNAVAIAYFRDMADALAFLQEVA
jgi:hypothetical protein